MVTMEHHGNHGGHSALPTLWQRKTLQSVEVISTTDRAVSQSQSRTIKCLPRTRHKESKTQDSASFTYSLLWLYFQQGRGRACKTKP